MEASNFTLITASIPERRRFWPDLIKTVEAQTLQPKVWLIRTEEPDKFGARHAAKQRNALVRAVDTEWFAVLDDDDLLDPEYLETLSRQAKKNVDVVYAFCRQNHHEVSEWDPEKLLDHNYICGEAFIRTSTFLSVGGYPEDTDQEDWELYKNILKAGGRFVCVPKYLWEHRRGNWRTATKA